MRSLSDNIRQAYVRHTPTHTHPMSIQTELVPILRVCVFAFTLTARMCLLPPIHIFFPDVFFGCLFSSAFVEFQKENYGFAEEKKKYGPDHHRKGEKWSLLSFSSAIIGGTNFNSTMSSNHKSPEIISYFFLHCFGAVNPSINLVTSFSVI